MMFRVRKLLACVFTSFLATAHLGTAAVVNLAWDPRTDPTVTGYFLYYGQASRIYTEKIDIRGTNQFAVTNLQNDVKYYFGITAYNAATLESDFSNEVFTSITNSLTNMPPQLNLPTNQVVNEGIRITLTATVTNSDLTISTVPLSLVSGPPGITGTTNGTLQWTPSESQGPAVYDVVTRVLLNDSLLQSLSQTYVTNVITVTVKEINRQPVLTTIPTQVAAEGSLFVITNRATDPDMPANPLTYTLLSGPSNATISANGVINWLPTETQAPGSFTIVTRVTDLNTNADTGQQISRTNSFTVTVNEINAPPSLSEIPPQTVRIANLLTVTNTAQDIDLPRNALTYTLLAGPTNATIDANGIITWIPTQAQGTGSFTFTTRVLDLNTNSLVNTQLSATNTFTVIVIDLNTPPTLAPILSKVLQPRYAYSFTNVAFDAETPAPALRFLIAEGPPRSTIDAAGVFRWTPSKGDRGNSFPLRIVVNDNGNPILGATQSCVLTVSSTSTPISTIISANGLQVDGGSGSNYIIDASTNLISWSTLLTTNVTTLPLQFEDPDKHLYSHRFYRVIEQD